VPTGGESGDFYIKTDDEKIYENVAGTWTVKLDIGGGVWTSSASNGTGGESGDWHINTTTKDIQENVSGTWTTKVNLSVSGSNIQDLGNVPALSSGKFLTNDGINTSWATVDVTGSAVGGDVTGTVGNIQLAANSVTNTEIASGAVNSDSVQNGTITGTDIASTTITGNNITDGAINSAKIQNGTVTGTDIATGTITGNQIAANTIADSKITGLSSSKLSGSLPAIDGSALTNMPSSGGTTQVFRQSWSSIGAVGNGGTTPYISFTPSTTGKALFCFQWSYRAADAGHVYVESTLYNSSGQALSRLNTYGGNHANGNSSWNQGVGGVISPGDVLLAGFTYRFGLGVNGSTANPAGDNGQDLSLSVIMLP
jgi:hypothetical protein